MRKFQRWILLSTASCALALAQQPGDLPPQEPTPRAAVNDGIVNSPRPVTKGRYNTLGKPLPEGDSLTIMAGTNDVYSVAPYSIITVPYSTKEGVVEIDIQKPAGAAEGQPIGKLPNQVVITGKELGTSTIVLSLVKEGEKPFERRIEIVVVDEISNAYKNYLETTIKQAYPSSAVSVHLPNTSTAVITGFVQRVEEVDAVVRIVSSFLVGKRQGGTQQAPTGAAPGTAQAASAVIQAGNGVTVIPALRVLDPSQVRLETVIVEVSRTKLREFGFDFTYGGGGSQTLIRNLIGPGVLGTSGQGFTLNAGQVNQFDAFIRAVETNNLGKLLSRPIIVTKSGQPATVNVGGQVPILTPQTNAGGGSGGVSALFTIQYRNFGTSLKFLPTVLGDGRIRLDVRPEVSERDDGNGVVIAGAPIPGFRTRFAESTVEMEPGQTTVIGGLIQTRKVASLSKVPVLGSIPGIGWAFSNKSYRQEETELLIMVTPYLAEATDERPCELPGHESRVPNDWELYIGGKFEPPCFNDPYRGHIKNHFNNVPSPQPQPDRPWDNYGRKPGVATPASHTAPTNVTPVPPMMAPPAPIGGLPTEVRTPPPVSAISGAGQMEEVETVDIPAASIDSLPNPAGRRPVKEDAIKKMPPPVSVPFDPAERSENTLIQQNAEKVKFSPATDGKPSAKTSDDGLPLSRSDLKRQRSIATDIKPAEIEWKSADQK